MTPEQENDLVARWMGWTCVPDHPIEGTTPVRYYAATWGKPQQVTHYHKPPPYRTDPALLWELMLKLHKPEHGWWCFRPYYESEVRGNSQDPTRDVFLPSMAEAVFAAAVMQAEQEGK